MQQCFAKPYKKFQDKQASHSGTGAQGTWQPMIFIYFTSSSPSKFFRCSSFNFPTTIYKIFETNSSFHVK